MEWTQCPQCGLVAEVVDRDVWPSTDGPIEHLHVRCLAGHRFVLPTATLERHHAAARAAQAAQAAPAAPTALAAAGRELQRREPAGRELVPVRVRRRVEPPR